MIRFQTQIIIVNNFVDYLLIIFFLFNFTLVNFTKIEFSDHALF